MKMHISLNVGNISESVAFYQSIFGVAPQKSTASYAKFDLNEPMLNLAMHEAIEGRSLSQVNHLGVEVKSADEVKLWQARLEQAGVLTRPEEDVDCCYARQDKVWFEDPSGNAWEIFYVHEQLPTVGAEPPQVKKAAACGPGTGCC